MRYAIRSSPAIVAVRANRFTNINLIWVIIAYSLKVPGCSITTIGESKTCLFPEGILFTGNPTCVCGYLVRIILAFPVIATVM